MQRWLVALLAACGGKPAVSTIAQPSAPPAASCSDVGVILRGPLDAEAAQGGPAREAAIAKACTTDRWALDIVACVANRPKPTTCLDRLAPAQRAAYEASLAAWSEQYGGAAYGGQGYDGLVSPPAVVHVDCATVAAGWTAPPDDPPRTQAAIRRLCDDDQWPDVVRVCYATGGPCPEALDDGSRAHLDQKLDEIHSLATKIAAARAKPATIDCKHVVATHYGDAAWKGKLTTLTPAQRKKEIASSRDAMLEACNTGWDETLRACIVAGGGDDCYAAGEATCGYGMPAECYDYQAAIEKLQHCDQLPKESREALRQGFGAAASGWGSLPPEASASLGEACKAGADAVVSVGKASCGW